MSKSFMLVCVVVLFALTAHPQTIGDTVRLKSDSAQGVPVHAAPGDSSYVRWAGGTIGKVTDEDGATHWLKVEAAGKDGWVTKRYLVVVAADSDTPEPPENELLTYTVGCWNLEWFHFNHTRGFPENTDGGPSYPERQTADYQRIAEIITNRLAARLLVLSEIGGQGNNKSAEMDRLLTHLGNTWTYSIGDSGADQHIAMLYDTSAVRKDSIQEIAIAEDKEDGSDIFYRDPLVGRFTFLDRAQHPQNDFIVVGIHLASGEDKVANHNKAMSVLRTRLHALVTAGTLPAAEKDILIMGDMNASRYDLSAENFWTGYDSTGFKFAALCPDDGSLYPPTRLANVPLHPRSQIDYIFGSTVSGGISTELVQLLAQVHTELTVPGGFDDFRHHVSDHLPVTVNIRVLSDDD